MLILDLGAGDATSNDIEYIEGLMKQIPTGPVLKFQLFEDIPGLTPLDTVVFAQAVLAGEKMGHTVTASAFDKRSLHMLTHIVKVPFIKIAARPELYWLIERIPPELPVVASCDGQVEMAGLTMEQLHRPMSYMCCIPKYPADQLDYPEVFPEALLRKAISDHTVGLELFTTYRPRLYEKHLDLRGPDQEWSIRLEDIRWVLDEQDYDRQEKELEEYGYESLR